MPHQRSCMEVALEGERHCKSGDCRLGVKFFEAAVQIGTNDLHILSAIYSQLGNAYFILHEYGKSLEYHRHDVNLARTIGDRLGEAKASGNLGNTLKLLGKYDEAFACCQHHLDIARELDDKNCEARALYNLGSLYHAKGKQLGRSANSDPGDYSPDVVECLVKAADYYEMNLTVVRELGDRAAQGRTCGNLGNVHYLLGNFSQAIKYHNERLSLAREFGDRSAERRAYSNLGNVHIFLGEFNTSVEYYNKTLQIAIELMDRALEAQACYSLGNTYTLMRNYSRAIEFHVRHLRIAQEMKDRIGEGRACWSLSNCYSTLGQPEKALLYTMQHLEISREIGDAVGQATAHANLTDLRIQLGQSTDSNDSLNMRRVNSYREKGGSESVTCSADDQASHLLQRRLSMENMELVKLTPDKIHLSIHGTALRPKFIARALQSSALTTSSTHDKSASRAENVRAQISSPEGGCYDDDQFFELLSRFQSRRIDDQRCCFTLVGGAANSADDKENNRLQANSPHAASDEFLDMVAGIQGARMNDQRASLSTFPGLNNSRAVIGQLAAANHREDSLDDEFFDMLMRCQGARIEDQRSDVVVAVGRAAAPTIPDEDFMNLIHRFQSSRLEEQRSCLPRADPVSCHSDGDQEGAASAAADESVQFAGTSTRSAQALLEVNRGVEEDNSTTPKQSLFRTLSGGGGSSGKKSAPSPPSTSQSTSSFGGFVKPWSSGKRKSHKKQ